MMGKQEGSVSGRGHISPAVAIHTATYAVVISEPSIYGATIGLRSSFSPLFLYLTLYSQMNAKIIQEH
jgi:hypothetical protein